VRLAFSVAIKAQGDILVLDEVLAVGDEAFQRKCNDFFTKVKKDPTKTVILVTHDMNAVKRYCTRAMMIEDGKIVSEGDPETVADRYTLSNLEAEQARTREDKGQKEKAEKVYPEGLNAQCPLLRVTPVSGRVSDGTKPFEFQIEYEYDQPGDFYLAISLNDTRRGGITYDSGPKVFRMKKRGHHTVRFSLPLDQFNNGDFTLVASLRKPNTEHPDETDMVGAALGVNSCSFVIRNSRNGDYALLSDRALRFTTQEDTQTVEVLDMGQWKNPDSVERKEEARRAATVHE
jgi:ABC-2 type transport system ATP-binding protein